MATAILDRGFLSKLTSSAFDVGRRT
jgi:hypothetical protein